jgi:hypothetical protein
MNHELAVNSTKAFSLNGSINSFTENFFLLGGKRVVMVMLPMMSRKRSRKATTRIAHPNPTRGIKCVTRIGKMTPPMDEPETMMPSASARCFAKKDPTAVIAITASAFIILAASQPTPLSRTVCGIGKGQNRRNRTNTYSGKTKNCTPTRSQCSARGRIGSIETTETSSSGRIRGGRIRGGWGSAGRGRRLGSRRWDP